LKQKKQRLLCW